MNDIGIGIVSVVVGAALCFRGYLTMRIIMPIWGAFAGFVFGSTLVALATGDGLLVGLFAWVAGGVFALLFAYLAYAYYAASVIISLAAIGFWIGTTVLLALGVEWDWLIIGVGILVGVLLAWAAIVYDLPTTLLVVLTAAAGSSAIIAGVWFLTDVIDVADVDRADILTRIDDSLAWWLLYAMLTIVGVIAQVSTGDRRRVEMRSQYR